MTTQEKKVKKVWTISTHFNYTIFTIFFMRDFLTRPNTNVISFENATPIISISNIFGSFCSDSEISTLIEARMRKIS